MSSLLEKKFTRIWQALKKNAGVKSSPWFKKADAAVSAKVEAYQKLRAKAHSGLVEDLLALGKALHDVEVAFVKFVDVKGLGQISEDVVKKTDKETLVAAINRYKSDLQHERSLFDSRLKSALSAADNDFKHLELLEAGKKKELWKGFGIEL